MERDHKIAMAIADTVLFLRFNGHHEQAVTLTEVATHDGVDPGVLAAAWLEHVG